MRSGAPLRSFDDWLLTGTAPFAGRTIVEICAAHIHKEPAPPSLRVSHAIPADLGTTNPSSTPESSSEFHELIAADWELAPGAEQVICVRQMLTKTRFVSAWRGDVPFGTHHLLLTAATDPDGEPDGQFECDAGTLAPQNLYGAGVGARDRTLPQGVAVKLAEGTQALFNVHLFNPTDKPLRGRSGVLARTMEEKDVREIADSVLASAVKLDLPPGLYDGQRYGVPAGRTPTTHIPKQALPDLDGLARFGNGDAQSAASWPLTIPAHAVHVHEICATVHLRQEN